MVGRDASVDRSIPLSVEGGDCAAGWASPFRKTLAAGFKFSEWVCGGYGDLARGRSDDCLNGGGGAPD